jgi:hypothetical protein
MNAKAARSILQEKGPTPKMPRTSSGLFGSLAAVISRYHLFHINHFSLSGILRGFATFGGHPGFLMFDHEKHHFGSLILRQGPNLLDYFDRTHPVLRTGVRLPSPPQSLR